MLQEHRHHEILSRLHSAGRVNVADVAAFLQVSDETIRRDMKELEKRGILRRIYGGAVRSRLDQERPLAERGKTNIREKAKIAILAEGLVQDGMSIFIDTGTTTLALARRLKGRALTISTNSIDGAQSLVGGNTKVNLTPGTLRANDNALVGYETVDYVKRYFFDIAFVGISACNIEHGWMDYEEHESVLRRTLKSRSRRTVILVDTGKFGLVANMQTFRLDETMTIVSNRAAPKAFSDVFRQLGSEVIS